jgi:hypothetical protein
LAVETPAETSKAYADAGHYILRDDWSAESDVLYFRCGPYGLGGEGESAHAHCDMLSPILWVGGRQVLVDAGTYLYHGPERDKFRLTASHNTLMIDTKEQAVPRTDFSWEQVPQAECLAYEAGKRVVGAMQTRAGVRHEREINHPNKGVWEILDILTDPPSANVTTHDLKWFFHFAPDLKLVLQGDGIAINDAQGHPFLQVIPPANVVIEIAAGEVSFNYGRKQPNQVIIATWQGAIPQDGVRFAWKFNSQQI